MIWCLNITWHIIPGLAHPHSGTRGSLLTRQDRAVSSIDGETTDKVSTDSINLTHMQGSVVLHHTHSKSHSPELECRSDATKEARAPPITDRGICPGTFSPDPAFSQADPSFVVHPGAC